MRATLLLMLTVAAGPALAQGMPPAPSTLSTLKPLPSPEADRSLPRQRLITVFGTEQCPKPTSPDEVVVCARLPEAEIYRIPAQLRRTETRQSVFSRNRSLLLGDSAGGAGGSIGSCSAVGPGGMIGCNNRQVDAWAADRTERMGYNEETPR